MSGKNPGLNHDKKNTHSPGSRQRWTDRGNLIADLMLPLFGNPMLAPLDDGACLDFDATLKLRSSVNG